MFAGMNGAFQVSATQMLLPKCAGFGHHKGRGGPTPPLYSPHPSRGAGARGRSCYRCLGAWGRSPCHS
ncbi:hypothetical protein AALO_G00293480 [Alosa alosa]|uniref:Uncharacterized protein n=1 Tax=Alosa alosa TaxID=278164 RepID=A0AAV6FKA4_9TELE|nr:hypothetical protein AALO_G00293480 [Alosa alosa]